MKYKKQILPNGLRLVTIPMKDNPAVTVLVMVEAGSKYETKNKNGISHFLEHMCFKGTTRRPSALDITRELDGIGSEYNAFTSQEFTGYYAKAHPKHFLKILDVVSDLYQNPVFPEGEIEKEKGVIIEEINMYEDLPQRQVGTIFMSLLYGDQPAGWSILGPKENIKKMSREDFVRYRKAHYNAPATTVVIAGHFDEKSVRKQVAKAFRNIPNLSKGVKKKVKEAQSKPAVLITHKDTDQTHLIIGVRAFGAKSKKIPAISVLSAVLGGGMSSRLFQRLRDELGICYYVRAGTDEYTDHGVLAVAAGVDTKRVSEAINAILNEFKKIKNEIVPASELQKAKDCLMGSMFLGLESSDSLAEFYANQEILTAKPETPDSLAKKIQKVSATEVKKIAQEIFQNKNLNLALVGRFKNNKKFIPLLDLS